MNHGIRSWVYGAVCAVLVGFLGWADATGYALFGQATKHTPSHSNPLYHK